MGSPNERVPNSTETVGKVGGGEVCAWELL